MNEVINNDRLAPEPEPLTLDRLAPEPEPFTLSSRRTIEVPSNRYSREHVLRNSRYPMKITREGVTDISRVFLTSLLAEDIPKTVQETSKKGE